VSYLNNHSFFDPPPEHPDYDPATGKRRAGGGAPVLLLLASRRSSSQAPIFLSRFSPLLARSPLSQGLLPRRFSMLATALALAARCASS